MIVIGKSHVYPPLCMCGITIKRHYNNNVAEVIKIAGKGVRDMNARTGSKHDYI